jgi:hypothetical protein
MRQKIRRAEKLGYTFSRIEHDEHLDEIFEINTSKAERQGREMKQSYQERPAPRGILGDEQRCPRHREDWFGVFTDDGTLVAYASVPLHGEMMLISIILGHGDHMENGIMNLLVFETVKWHRARSGTEYAVYHLHDSGTEGLQFFKRKMGFAGHLVQFELGRTVRA